MAPDIATETVSGVKTVVFDGVIESAYGSKLADARFKPGSTPVTSLAYVASFEELTSYDAIPAKELPDKDDILSVVNQARKANARQKAMQKALDDAGVIKPTLADDVNLQLATMVKAMVASKKYTEETATAAAKTILGL